MVELIWIIIILLLILFIRLYLRNNGLKKTKLHLIDIPAFDNGLIDCYVKIRGSIKSKNTFTSPISKAPCAFYNVKVLALWQTKRKKPAKGMEEQKKVIFNTSSPRTQLEIYEVEGKEIVNIDISEFLEEPKYLLMNKTTESRQYPQICKTSSNNKKYKKYKILENWCSYANKIVVYGKLIKTNEGLLSIKTTKLAAYPSFICLEPFEELPLKKLDKKIKNNNIWLIVFLIGIVVLYYLIKY
jgi:hypothetical protein